MIKELTLAQILERAKRISDWVRCDGTFSIYYIGKIPKGIEIVVEEEAPDDFDYDNIYSIKAKIGSCNLGRYTGEKCIDTLFNNIEKIHEESAKKSLIAYLSKQK